MFYSNIRPYVLWWTSCEFSTWLAAFKPKHYLYTETCKVVHALCTSIIYSNIACCVRNENRYLLFSLYVQWKAFFCKFSGWKSVRVKCKCTVGCDVISFSCSFVLLLSRNTNAGRWHSASSHCAHTKQKAIVYRVAFCLDRCFVTLYIYVTFGICI